MEAGIRIVKLVVVVSRNPDSWMFHTVNIRWALWHGDLIGVEAVALEVSGVKEEEVRELAEGLKLLLKECGDVNYLITGAVRSLYQRKRVDSVAEELGLIHYSPLWGADEASLLREEVSNLGVIVTAVQAYGMGKGWLGRRITGMEVDELIKLQGRHSVSPVGEGGEFETFVVSSPLFRGHGLGIRKASIMYDEFSWRGYYVIEDAAII